MKPSYSARSKLSSGQDTNSSARDYQRIMEEAERETRGETPPPSTSPLHTETNNNNTKAGLDTTQVKRLRKKKKKSGDKLAISTVGELAWTAGDDYGGSWYRLEFIHF